MWRVFLAGALVWTLSSAQPALAQRLDPIVYTVRMPAPETQYAHVEATVPTSRAAAVEMMMPIWSPGYYRVEDYAARVDELKATTLDGVALTTEKSQKNRWRIETGGAATVVVSYRVQCTQRSVTTNWVDANYAVLNGAPTFMTLVDERPRTHLVRVELPVGWTRVMTGLADVSGGQSQQFRAPDYETLVDSPILAGKLAVRQFDVAGKPHFVVAAGDYAAWDGDAGTRDLAAIVRESHRLWGFCRTTSTCSS